MATESRTCAILYADVVKSSQITASAHKMHLLEFRERLASQSAALADIAYAKASDGDKIVLVGNTPAIIAEEALRIRNQFRDHDWERAGFSKPVEIRIGVDFKTVVLISEGGSVIGVTGQGMDMAARVEPIVAPGHVFCTATFRNLLTDEGVSNIHCEPLGERELDKGAGRVELFDMYWKREVGQHVPPAKAQTSAGAKPRMPRIKGQITDKDRDAFLRDTFVTIKAYFETAANQLSTEAQAIDATVQTIHALKFVCDVYVNGESKNRCKVWLSQGSYLEGIGYAEGNFSIDADNSYNETIRVEDDGHELYLEPMGMRSYGNRDDRLTPEASAEFLWETFIERLEH